MTIQPSECYRVGEFARRAGISVQRLHQLHRAGRGPRRVSIFVPDARGRRRARVRGIVGIPKIEGEAWLRERASAKR